MIVTIKFKDGNQSHIPLSENFDDNDIKKYGLILRKVMRALNNHIAQWDVAILSCYECVQIKPNELYES